MIAEPTVSYTPRGSYYRVRISQAALVTRGGIFLPDSTQECATEAQVVSCGPGAPLPGLPARSLMSAEVGDKILFLQWDFHPVEGAEGLVDEEDVVGIVDPEDGAVIPQGQWVRLAIALRDQESAGGILIPEQQRKRHRFGTIEAFGPGAICKKGPFTGTRKRVAAILGVPADEPLVGCKAHWDAKAHMLEIEVDGVVKTVLVKAQDIIALEGE